MEIHDVKELAGKAITQVNLGHVRRVERVAEADGGELKVYCEGGVVIGATYVRDPKLWRLSTDAEESTLQPARKKTAKTPKEPWKPTAATSPWIEEVARRLCISGDYSLFHRGRQTKHEGQAEQEYKAWSGGKEMNTDCNQVFDSDGSAHNHGAEWFLMIPKFADLVCPFKIRPRDQGDGRKIKDKEPHFKETNNRLQCCHKEVAQAFIRAGLTARMKVKKKEIDLVHEYTVN